MIRVNLVVEGQTEETFVRIAQKIGLDAIRQACPHFAQWLASLESLARLG